MEQKTKFQRLVEVMSTIDKSFKPKLNEDSYGDDDYMERNEKFEYNDRMDAEFRKFASDLYQKQNRINIKDELYSFADRYNFQRSAVDDALNKPEFMPNKKEGYDYLVYDLNKIDNIINHIVNSSGSQMTESGYLGENREQSLTVSLEDKDFEVYYEYEAEEKDTRDYQGSPESIMIGKIEYKGEDWTDWLEEYVGIKVFEKAIWGDIKNRREQSLEDQAYSKWNDMKDRGYDY